MTTTRGPPPAPAAATTSSTPSLFMSPVPMFTCPVYPGPNGDTDPPTDPSDIRHWMRLVPSAVSPNPTTVGAGTCVTGGTTVSLDRSPGWPLPGVGGGSGGGTGVLS